VGHQRTVLVVDDERLWLDRFERMLDGSEFTVIRATTRRAAQLVAASSALDVALIDYRLTHTQDGLSLARVLKQQYGIPFVLVSGFLNTAVTVRAMREGAANVIDKPVDAVELKHALAAAVESREESSFDGQTAERTELPRHEPNLRRLAGLMLAACGSRRDPATVSALAREGAVSAGAFRGLCRMCGVRAKEARDLARFLRAVSLSQLDNSMVRCHLSFADERTAARLFGRAGLDLGSRAVPLRDFIRNQRFIAMDRECLHALSHMAANSTRFTL